MNRKQAAKDITAEAKNRGDKISPVSLDWSQTNFTSIDHHQC